MSKKEVRILIKAKFASLNIVRQYYNNCGDNKAYSDNEVRSVPDGYYNAIVISSFDAFANAILKAINSEHEVDLDILLKRNFIYGISNKSKKTDSGLDGNAIYRSAIVRPVVEAFFYDRIDLLQHIIIALLQKENLELIEIFMKACQSIDVNPDDIYSWNYHVKSDTLKRLNKLHKYAYHLSRKFENNTVVDMGAKLFSLTNRLISDVKSEDINASDQIIKGLQNLLFKLKLREGLHEEDDSLSEEYVKCNKIKSTFASIANHSSSHHNTFFKPQTKLQKNIDKIEAVLFPGWKKR